MRNVEGMPDVSGLISDLLATPFDSAADDALREPRPRHPECSPARFLSGTESKGVRAGFAQNILRLRADFEKQIGTALRMTQFGAALITSFS